jgi:hypothetical protein
MSVDQMAALDLDDLPTDRFELADEGLEVESLTVGHDTPPNGNLVPLLLQQFLADREHTHNELVG